MFTYFQYIFVSFIFQNCSLYSNFTTYIILLNMSNKEKIKQILVQVQKLRVNNQISSQKLQNYLYYQHIKIVNKGYSFIDCGVCGKTKVELKQSFKRAFKTLSDLQMAEFYLLNCKSFVSIINSDTSNIQNSVNSMKKIEKKFRLSVKSDLIFKKWTDVTVEFLPNQKIMKLLQNKIQIDFHKYILRRSKNKDKICLVLQATEPGPLGDTVRITNFELQLQQIFNLISELWEKAQYQNINDMIQSDRSYKSFQNKNIKLLRPASEIAEDDIVLQPKININRAASLPFKQLKNEINLNLFKKQENVNSFSTIIRNFQTFNNFQEKCFGQYYEKNGLRVRKVLQFKKNDKNCEYYQNLIKNLRQKKQSNRVTLKDNENMNQINNIHINILQIQQNKVLFLYQLQEFQFHGSKYMIQKNIENKNNLGHHKQVIYDLQAHLHYCIWRIREIGDKIQIFVEAKIQYSKNDKKYKRAHKYSSSFIGNLMDLITNQIQTKNNTSYKKKNQNANMLQVIQNQEQFYSIEASMCVQKEEPRQQLVLQKYIGNQELKKQIQQPKVTELNSNDILKHKYLTNANVKGEKQCLRSDKGHWLWQKQWEMRQNGDIVNIDQEKIKAQSSVLQLIVKRMGRNLFSGKSIMNMSLPVQIFGPDSHLERLAKGYLFAPTFLEKAAAQTNPVDRMKFIICFGLGFSLNYIRMDKPFNPILGETYQGIVDGCPIYGEQISHHPPISSLYMVGRGYRIYASFQAKVEFGFNTAAGSNDGYNHVQFESDNAVVKLSTPPGELSGLIYGDRKVTVIKKTHCIDEKNKLVCEISWGKNKSSKSELAKYNDFFCGKIVRVKEQVPVSSYTNLKSSQIQEEYGFITGRLSQQVYYGDQKLLDVNYEQPHLVSDYSPCLDSDCRHRKDILYRKQNNFIASQQAKQQLQQIQRRDRKLRQAHHPNSH